MPRKKEVDSAIKESASVPASSCEQNTFSREQYLDVIAQRNAAHQLLIDIWQDLSRRQILIDSGLMEYISSAAGATNFLTGVGYKEDREDYLDHGHIDNRRVSARERAEAILEKRGAEARHIETSKAIDAVNADLGVGEKHWFSRLPLSRPLHTVFFATCRFFKKKPVEPIQ